MSEKENEDMVIWKQKAIERRIEIKELNKRRKELYLSRENWKSKYITEKHKILSHSVCKIITIMLLHALSFGSAVKLCSEQVCGTLSRE